MAVRVPAPLTASAARRVELPNGVVLIAAERRTHPTVAVRCAVRGGQAEEPSTQAGLACLSGAALVRGTRHLPRARLAGWLDDHGVVLSSSVQRHSLEVAARCLADDTRSVIELLGQVCRAPAAGDDDLALLRLQLEAGIVAEERDPSAVAVGELRRRAYPAEHPYSRRLNGSAEGLSRVAGDDVRRFLEDQLRPERTVLVVAGDVDFDALRADAERAFGDWAPPPGRPVAMPADIVRASGGRYQSAMRGVPQGEVIVGMTTVSRLDPRFSTLQLCTVILGQLGSMGRLGALVRGQRGLAYYAYAALEDALAPGLWTARLGVSSQVAPHVAELVVQEMRRLSEEPVPQSELDAARSLVLGQAALSRETNEGIARVLQARELYGLSVATDAAFGEFAERLRAITPEALQSTARDLLAPEDAIVVTAG